MDHDVQGVAFRVSGMRVPLDDGRWANGVELLRVCAWGEARALVDQVIPGLGTVADVRAPRVNPMPVGTRFNVITTD